MDDTMTMFAFILLSWTVLEPQPFWVKEVYISPLDCHDEERAGHELLYLNKPYYACGQAVEVNSTGQHGIILDYSGDANCWEYKVQP